MTSVVSICNLALGNIGKDRIDTLTEASAQASACNLFYEHVRDTLLQSYPWRFAGKTQSLAEITNDKTGAWGHAYSKPNDCMKVRWVRPQYSTLDCMNERDEIKIPYDLEGEKLYCNLSPAFLRYTFKLTDPTKFPPLFVDALSWHLAVRLAMPLTKDIKTRNDCYQLARQMQDVAQTSDANEVRENSDHDSEFIEGRS